MSTTETTGPKSVQIRTNIGWVTVPTTYAGGVSQADIDAAIAKLEKDIQAKYATKESLDDKLDKASFLTEEELTKIIQE